MSRIALSYVWYVELFFFFLPLVGWEYIFVSQDGEGLAAVTGVP